MDTKNETHPLLQKEFRSIPDWQTWKRLWDQAEYGEQLLTLLHGAFDCNAFGVNWADRLIFLLRVADGHDADSPYWPREPVASHMEWDARQARINARKPIAEKAFQVLCDKYFKQFAGSSRSPASEVTPELQEALLWFFGDHDRRPYGRNLPRVGDKRHYGQVAREYLRAFVRASWPLGRSRGERSAETEAKLPGLRLRYVALLDDLRDLHFLYEEKENIEDVAVEALRRYTLFDKDGKEIYRDTDEAVHTYSGQVLLVLETMLREAERKRRIAAAERKQREAERELKEARK